MSGEASGASWSVDVSGQLPIRMDDGTEMVARRGDVISRTVSAPPSQRRVPTRGWRRLSRPIRNATPATKATVSSSVRS
jgi:hypothetical protein